MIDQTSSGKYIIVGEPKVHKSLEALVEYYRKSPVNEDGDLLTLPCGQAGGHTDYSDLLDDHANGEVSGSDNLPGMTFSLNTSTLLSKPAIRRVKDKGNPPVLPPRKK